MARDLHHNIKAVRAISAATLGATAAGGAVGKVVNRQGFESLEFVVNVGSITATNATVTAVVKEGDATGALTAAAAADVLGSLTIAGATSARASGVSKNFVKRIGYIGKRQYASITLVPTVSGGIIAAADAVLAHPINMPVAEQ